MHVYVCIYIYIYRERERDTYIYIYIYTHTYMCIAQHITIDPRAAESGVSSWSWHDPGLSSPAGRSSYFVCSREVRAFNGSQSHPRVRDLERMVDVSRAEDAVDDVS